MTAPRVDWMTNPEARRYTGTDLQRHTLLAAAERLTWLPWRRGLDLPASPGLAVQEVRKQLDLRKVSQLAVDGCIANRYGFYGIEAWYAEQTRVRVYILDRGADALPLFCQVWQPGGLCVIACSPEPAPDVETAPTVYCETVRHAVVTERVQVDPEPQLRPFKPPAVCHANWTDEDWRRYTGTEPKCGNEAPYLRPDEVEP